MASLFQRLRSAIGRAVGRRPKAPVVRSAPMGHRGIAAGKLPSFEGEQLAQAVDLKVRDDQAKLAQLKLTGATQTEINKVAARIDRRKKQSDKLRNPQQFERYGGTGKWKVVPGDTVAGFVHDAQPLFVHSSNVAMFQYFIEERKLIVEFLGGGVYSVDPVSEQEAVEIAQAPSKGGWYWSHVRIRGKGRKRGLKNGEQHRKNVVRIR